MKLFRYLLLMTAGLTLVHLHGQQETGFERKLDSRDEAPAREFVESKENIDIKKKANNLEISGDVRFVWQNQHEKGEVLYVDGHRSGSNSDSFSPVIPFDADDYVKSRYRRLRGGDRVGRDQIPISFNNFNVKFSVRFKYDFDQTWSMAHLQFNNLAGTTSVNECNGFAPVFNEFGNDVVRFARVNREYLGKGSGFGQAINMRRAYIGHTLYAGDNSRLDMEVGRRQLDDLFMSEIQFNNYFDGVAFEYASAIDKFSDWYLTAGVFVVDQRVDHFAPVIEIGFLNILDSKIDVRYSFIDWRAKLCNRCFIFDPEGSKFEISQITLAYQMTPTICDYALPMELYGGFLVNTAATRNPFTSNKKANLGWYFDLYMGNVRKKGDWSFEFIYTAVQAQAVPDYDVCGVGRGNIMNNRLEDYLPGNFPQLSTQTISSGSSEINGYIPGQGNANFQGCLFDFLYAVTDNFSIDFSGEFSYALDKKIGGAHKYHSVEIEFLYAF